MVSQCRFFALQVSAGLCCACLWQVLCCGVAVCACLCAWVWLVCALVRCVWCLCVPVMAGFALCGAVAVCLVRCRGALICCPVVLCVCFRSIKSKGYSDFKMYWIIWGLSPDYLRIILCIISPLPSEIIEIMPRCFSGQKRGVPTFGRPPPQKF